MGEGVLCCVCLKYRQLMGNALTTIDFYYTENSMYMHLSLSVSAAADTDRNMHAYQLASYMQGRSRHFSSGQVVLRI